MEFAVYTPIPSVNHSIQIKGMWGKVNHYSVTTISKEKVYSRQLEQAVNQILFAHRHKVAYQFHPSAAGQ